VAFLSATPDFPRIFRNFVLLARPIFPKSGSTNYGTTLGIRETAGWVSYRFG
jgi:hypothetical protein